MFFLEAIVKYIKKDKFSEILDEHDRMTSINPLEQIPLEDDFDNDEAENCEHIFMPVDSTGEILACSKCGQIKKKEDLKPVNFFNSPNSDMF